MTSSATGGSPSTAAGQALRQEESRHCQESWPMSPLLLSLPRRVLARSWRCLGPSILLRPLRGCATSTAESLKNPPTTGVTTRTAIMSRHCSAWYRQSRPSDVTTFFLKVAASCHHPTPCLHPYVATRALRLNSIQRKPVHDNINDPPEPSMQPPPPDTKAEKSSFPLAQTCPLPLSPAIVAA